MYAIKCISEINEDVICQWKSLWDNVNHSHYFNSPSWFLSCANISENKKYTIFLCYRDEKLCAIAPLIERYKFFAKALASPGGKYLDKSTLLFDKLTDLFALIEHICHSNNLFLAELERDFCLQIKNAFANVLVEFSSDNPYIELSEPFKYLKNEKKNRIKNKIKKFKNELNFEMYWDKSVSNKLEVIYDIEKQSHKQKRGISVFHNSNARQLFENITRVSPDNSAVAILYYLDKPIAHMFGLVYRNIFQDFHMAFVEDYKHLGPGKILLVYLLETIKGEGFKIFDFSRGRNQLKTQFTELNCVHHNIYIPNNLLTRLWWQFVLISKKMVFKLIINIGFLKKIIPRFTSYIPGLQW